MPPGSALAEFWEAYVTAGDDDARRTAISEFRARYPELLALAETGDLLLVLETLLRHCHSDGIDARFLAARLLRDLWTGLSPAAIDGLFEEFTLRMLAGRTHLRGDERRILWEAIEGGCEIARPSVVGAVCRELAAREVERCLDPAVRSRIRNWLAPPAPDLEVVELIAQFAPAGEWPGLTRGVWRLYDLVNEGVGGPDGGVFWLGFSQRLLLRVLGEARPDDLGDAIPRLFKYLEGLAGMDRVLEPLLPALVTWELPPTVKVLERWSQKAASAAFRQKAAGAADALRAALGDVGAEIAPAEGPHGRRREAVPASSPGGDGAGRHTE